MKKILTSLIVEMILPIFIGTFQNNVTYRCIINKYIIANFDYLKKDAITYTISLVIILIIGVLIILLIRYMIKLSTNILRQGSKDYIEGWWIQKIDDNNIKGVLPTMYSIVEIKRANDNKYIVIGKSFNHTTNEQVTSFTSIGAELRNNNNTVQLHYFFDFTSSEIKNSFPKYGKTELTFFANDKNRIIKYEGVVYSSIRTNSAHLRENGVRVKAVKIKRNMIDLKTPEGLSKIDEILYANF